MFLGCFESMTTQVLPTPIECAKKNNCNYLGLLQKREVLIMVDIFEGLKNIESMFHETMKLSMLSKYVIYVKLFGL